MDGGWVAKLWGRVWADPVSPDGREIEHERRFLRRLAGSLVPSAIVVGIVVLPRWLRPDAPTSTASFKAGVLVTVSGLATLWLSRRVPVRWAARFFVGTLIAAPLVAAADRAEILVFMFASVLVATAALTRAGAITVGVLAVAVQPVLLLRPGVQLADLVIPLCVNGVLIPLLFVVQSTHRQLDRARLDDARRSERRFATTLCSIGDAVLAADTAGRVSFINPVAARLTGWSDAEARGRPVDQVFRAINELDDSPIEHPVERVLREGRAVVLSSQTVLVARDGSRRPIADSGAPILDDDGRAQGVVLVFRDMTEEKELRERLERSQRFESLGRLAGGVAHDFNNLLTVIGGGVSLALDEAGPAWPARPELEAVEEATGRAVALTRQLLAFSRRQVLQPRLVEINAAVTESVKMIRRVLKESVSLHTELAVDPGRVLVDPVQLGQVLVNLALNGADAMPEGGALTVETDSVVLSADAATPLPAGTYVRLQVIDTGTGMDKRTLARAFEPFFSTKRAGHGTGLGLATVDGIVQQSGGAVQVTSELGKGTTFTVLLPRQPEAASGDAAPQPPAATRTGTRDRSGGIAARTRSDIEAPRKILVVEDDPAVRRLVTQILEAAGITVLTAGSGDEALTLRDRHAAEIDLLVTDIVMPGMTGPRVARAFRTVRPRLPVLFMSGYADEVIAHDGMQANDGSFIEKPFTPATFLAKVRSLLAPPPLPVAAARLPRDATD